MGNYKPFGHSQLSIKPVTRPINVATLKILYFFSLGAGAKSLFDLETQLVYTVPASKKFVTYGFITVTIATTGTKQVFEGDTLNGIDTLKTTYTTPALAISHENWNPDAEFAATKYVTIDDSAATMLSVFCYGHEENA